MLLPAAVVVVIDPYQVFHKSWLPEVYFYKENERYQMAGLIKHYLGAETGTDTVIIGTSLSVNFLEEDIEQRLGWKALNMAMRGSTLAERSVVMQRAIATGAVRHVLLEINPIDGIESVDDLSQNDKFPAFLYSNDYSKRQQYVFNQTVVLQALGLYRQSYPFTNGSLLDTAWPVLNTQEWTGPSLHHWLAWMETTEPLPYFTAYNTLENLTKLKEGLAVAREQQSQQSSNPWERHFTFAAAQRDVVDVVRANPTVDFRIWFAPVSVIRFAQEPDLGLAANMIELRRFLVMALANVPNVKLYGVDRELTVTGNLDNYMDTQHFTMTIQRWVLDSIASEQYRVTPDNINGYAESLRNNILQFDVVVPENIPALPHVK